MKTVEISVNWNNEDSIKEAEKTKFNLECKGYILVNQFGSMDHSVIIYAKPAN